LVSLIGPELTPPAFANRSAGFAGRRGFEKPGEERHHAGGLRHAAERDRGLAPVDAIREAWVLRFRPIMTTTAAAMLAGLPLMLGTGTGSELRQPLGFAMVGGLALSQVLTLYATPVVYLYLDRLQAWLSGKHEPDQAAAAEAQAAE
jgi:hypothetical protein